MIIIETHELVKETMSKEEPKVIKDNQKIVNKSKPHSFEQ